MATIVTQITTTPTYDIADELLLNPSITQSSFNPSVDHIDYYISTPNNSFSTINYNYSRYSFPTDGVTSNNISNIQIDPETDLINQGFNSGEYIVSYNFLRNHLNSSFDNKRFFIKEISSDRTEVVLSVNDPSNVLILEIEDFKNYLNSDPNYFQDFFLNFGENNLNVANNIYIDNTTFDIYVNLYSPLPTDIQIKNTLWIVTQVAEELTFNITFTPEIITPTIVTYSIKGPNLNLPIQDQTNNSTGFQTYESLITSSLLSTSYSQLNNLISSSGIEINIDYTDFSNFTHFSSAVTRINNFVYKVSLIEQYSASIASISSLTGYDTSSNILLLTNQINNIIENFDGYEYYLYYSSGSWAYPKSNSTVPYVLYPTSSTQVTNWLGNVENLTGILGSASIYDQSNSDYLYNTVPNFIQEDPQNDPYKTFVEMVAQSYDNIWIYYKDVTNRYNADNRLDFGISKDLVANALKSFGVKLYQNNFSTNDLYSSFLGYGAINPDTTGSLPVTAGSGQEYINNYITASYDASVMPLDDVNKETYKRLYHNLPYLAKTKGTIPGLRALINCFGIPDTILRISEFGGRDKDTSTYDYFDQQYNYALYVTGSTDYIATSFTLNPNWDLSEPYIKPSSIQFRFKPDINITTNTSQSLARFIDSTVPIYSQSLLSLEYTGSGYTSASYSGSIYSSSYAYANLIFYPNINDLTISASIYQPFFNGDWWTVQLDITSGSNDTFNLYAGSKGYYDGYDGNQILHLASSSISTLTTNVPWNGSSGNIRFSGPPITIGSKTFLGFEGYLQEVRYWTKTGSIESFKDFVMNPHSIDYNSEENKYADYLAFRAPLGSELDTLVSGFDNMTSVHPKVTGSWITTSSFSSDSNYSIIGSAITSSNIESYFYDQPIAGIKNRVTDKIQIVSSSYPTGSVLSQYRSLEQTYPTLGSETPDINLLEVAFSPQNEINDDIISSLGYFNIGEYIGDPRQVSSSATTYPDLVNLSNNFFQKYFASYNLFDYIRLIKYFDNSLFKMIQDFVPARTSLTSGVVIKQHLLERNKYPQPQVEWEDVTYSGSITTAFIDGGTGGTFDSYNFTGSTIPPTFINNTQSWGEEVKTPVGLLTISHSTQDEFYNGELPNSLIIATNGELNEANNIKSPSDTAIIYNPVLYTSDTTLESTFTNPLTSPKSGEVFLWWDSGSLTNPGNTKIIYVKGSTNYFNANRTNGVKYIKLNNIDANGNDQSDYLTQLQTITLTYPDRPDVTYNIVGYQNFGNHFLYSIGPYTPGSMTNFNTSSVGDILNYDENFSASFDVNGDDITTNYFNFGLSSGSISPTTGSGVFAALTGNANYMYIGSTRTPNTKYTVTASFTVTNINVGPGSNTTVQFYATNGNIGNENILTFDDGTANGGASTLLNLKVDISNILISGSPIFFGILARPSTNPLTFANDVTLNFNQTPLEFNGSSSIVIFDPYVSDFDYNDYNALINNAETPQTSVFFMDIDYSQNPVIPINQSLILSGSADRAQVQDSNYTSQAWSNIRYNGSKTNSYRIIS
jgi:hypothetical protein